MFPPMATADNKNQNCAHFPQPEAIFRSRINLSQHSMGSHPIELASNELMHEAGERQPSGVDAIHIATLTPACTKYIVNDHSVRINCTFAFFSPN